MNKEQAIKKIEELKEYVSQCDNKIEENKWYYLTQVTKEGIVHSTNKIPIKDKLVVYEDKNIIVECGCVDTIILYKNGEKP